MRGLISMVGVCTAILGGGCVSVTSDPAATQEAAAPPVGAPVLGYQPAEVAAQRIYRHRPKSGFFPPSENIRVTGDTTGLSVKLLRGGSLASIISPSGRATFIPDSPGSTNIHVVVDPAIGLTELAGLRFRSSCILNIWKDGIIQVNQAGVPAEGEDGTRYASREVQLAGQKAITMVREP